MLNKRLLESASVVVLTASLILGGVTHTVTKTAVDADSNQSQDATGIYAGATDYLDNLDLNSQDTVTAVTVEKEEVEKVTSADTKATMGQSTAEQTATQEQAEWQNRLIANLGESTLNIRATASKDGDLVGKMNTGDVGEILEQGTEWTLIKSGNAQGYVSNAYCLFGADAYAYAVANFKTVAKSTVDGLRVRATADANGEVVKKLAQGKSLEVDKNATSVEGWVAVTYDSKTCYVSADYVEVAMNYGTALTTAEIAKIEAEKKALQKAKQEKTKSVRKGSTGGAIYHGNYPEVEVVQRSGIDYTDEELFLLASLLYCEAGSQGYECQLACGAVVVNCVKSSKFPNTIHGVIYQKGQYGPARSGSLQRCMDRGSATKSCYEAARAALSGVDNTGGANSFQGVSCGYSGVEYNGMLFYKVK